MFSLRNLCLFHQKAIIRRYITDRPTTRCGKDLKELSKTICQLEKQKNFIDEFYKLKDRHQYFLHQRNEKGEYKQASIRAALKSIKTNLPNLFIYSDIPSLNTPPTNNHLEGFFGHLKERIKIHRGLLENRKKKAVKFLLKNLGNWKKKVKISPHFFNYANYFLNIKPKMKNIAVLNFIFLAFQSQFSSGFGTFFAV